MERIKIYADIRFATVFGVITFSSGIVFLIEFHYLLGILFLLKGFLLLFVIIHPKFTFIKPSTLEYEKEKKREAKNPGSYRFSNEGVFNKYNSNQWFSWSDIDFVKGFCYEIDSELELEFLIKSNNGITISLNEPAAQEKFLMFLKKEMQLSDFNDNWYKEIVYPHYLKEKEKSGLIKMINPKHYRDKPIIYKKVI